MNKILNKMILGILILAQINFASAGTLVRAETANPEAFAGWAEVNGGTTLAEQSAEDTAYKSEFNRILEAAQANFLTGSLSEAKREYARLISLAFLADWSRAQRKALLIAWMRLAQLSEAETERQRYLESAAGFAGELKPDSNLFPPPLVSAYEKIRDSLEKKAISISPKDRFTGFQYLVLNGRVYEIAKTPRLSILPGQNRLSLRSNVFAPVSQIMSASQILVFEPARQALASGDCSSPRWLGNAPYPQATVYFSDDCQFEFAAGKWTRSSGPEKKAPETNWANFSSPKADHEKQWADIQKPKTSIFKSKWFWIGAGVLAASAIVISENAKRGSGETRVNSSVRTQY